MAARWFVIALSVLCAACDLAPFLIGLDIWLLVAVVVVLAGCLYGYQRSSDKRAGLVRIASGVTLAAFILGALARLAFATLMYDFPFGISVVTIPIYALWFLPAAFAAAGVLLLRQSDKVKPRTLPPYFAVAWTVAFALQIYLLSVERF